MSGNTKAAGEPIRLGFIGMGGMGSRMARRLLAAGYPLTVQNRTREKALAMRRYGAQVAETAGELASRSDVVFLSLTDDAAEEQVAFRPEGMLEGLNRGAAVIDLSTVSPTASRRLHVAVHSREADMLDAPVAGTLPVAEQGALTILVGGYKETYERCHPLLEVLGKSIYHVGGAGMGATMKLVINTLLAVSMLTLGEVMAYGEAAGLDLGALLDVLGGSPVLSESQKGKLENVRRGEYPPLFSLPLMRKDLRLVLQEASEVPTPMPTAAAALQIYTVAQLQGLVGDFSSIIPFMRGAAGMPRKI